MLLVKRYKALHYKAIRESCCVCVFMLEVVAGGVAY